MGTRMLGVVTRMLGGGHADAGRKDEIARAILSCEPAEWGEEAALAAKKLLEAADLGKGGALTPIKLEEAWLVIASRDACKHGDSCFTTACRYCHSSDKEPLWVRFKMASRESPLNYSEGLSDLRGQEWSLMRNAFHALGEEAFKVACVRQTAVLRHFASRDGARFVLKGLPDPDQLQAFVLGRVEEIWGPGVVNRRSCQEYLDRSSARVKSTITGGDYSAPSRNPVSGHWGGPQGTVKIARVIKVGINNPNVDFKNVERDTAWHGCQARSLEDWKPDKPGTHPQFRIDKFKHTAHRPGVYVSPSFEQAVLYAFRRWDKQPRFGVMTTKEGERWNYLTVMQLALRDRGVPGVVDECQRTWPNANTDDWDPGKLEWVVRDVSKAQIYGILFCFFPDDPPQGG